MIRAGTRSRIPRWWTTAVFRLRPLRGSLSRSAALLVYARSARMLVAADRDPVQPAGGLLWRDRRWR